MRVSRCLCSNKIVRKFVTSFLEMFSTRNFSDMHGVTKSMINVYEDYKNRLIPLNKEETYQSVMLDEPTKEKDET